MNTLSATVDAMETYGLSPKDNILPSTALFALILNLAPVQPITAYALAASHELDSLAVSVSCHLLSYPLQKLTPELAVKIGPIYLRRLFFLHLGRLEALRRILLPPPLPHPSTWTCNFVDQRRLTRAWLLASASIAWDAGPGAYRDLRGRRLRLQSRRRAVGCESCADHARLQTCQEARSRARCVRSWGASTAPSVSRASRNTSGVSSYNGQWSRSVSVCLPVSRGCLAHAC